MYWTKLVHHKSAIQGINQTLPNEEIATFEGALSYVTYMFLHIINEMLYLKTT